MTSLSIMMRTVYSMPKWERIVLGTISIVCIVVLVIIRWKKVNEETASRVREVLMVMLGVVTVAVLRSASASGVQQMERALEWVMRRLGLQLTQLLIAFLVTGFGIGAYKFKGFNQKWYGIVEVFVGFLSAVFVAGTLTPGKLELAKWATLGGAAYVVQRGLGNYFEGKGPTPPKVAAAKG